MLCIVVLVTTSLRQNRYAIKFAQLIQDVEALHCYFLSLPSCARRGMRSRRTIRPPTQMACNGVCYHHNELFVTTNCDAWPITAHPPCRHMYAHVQATHFLVDGKCGRDFSMLTKVPTWLRTGGQPTKWLGSTPVPLYICPSSRRACG